MKTVYLEGRLRNYLARRSPPQFMAKNETAQVEELSALMRALNRAAPDSGFQEWWPRVEDVLDRELKTRAWPTVHEISEASRKVGGKPDGIKQDGDRSKMSHDELGLLTEKVLPTAKRWLTIPGLAEHGRKTLEYWGEHIDA